MDGINNGTYQLLKKDPATETKANTLNNLKTLKDSNFTDNKSFCYLKPTVSAASRFCGQAKIHKP